MTPEFELRSHVLDTMRPIIREYGYRLFESDDRYVRLDSDTTSIQVAYDRRGSFDINVSFSEQENGVLLRRFPFDLGEVYRGFGVPDASNRCFLQSKDLSKVSAFVKATCDLLLEHCHPILRGDREAFAAVNDRRTREAATYTRQIRVEAVREKAEKAWRNEEYKEFVNLLGEFRDMLSDAERKKLDYASRKVVGH